MYSSCTPYVVALPRKNAESGPCWVYCHLYYHHLSSSHAKLLSVGCGKCWETSVRGYSFDLESSKVVSRR